MVSAAMAQSFTIRRPADGSTVRETVAIQIPAGSIPSGSYVGIIVNGKFLEAASPALEGDNHVYRLDTKARRIPDGDMDIEVVLYNNYNDRVEVVNRSSVRVKLDNYTSIKVPEDGLKLRYKFRKGQELVYRNVQYQSAGMLSQAAAAIGSRAGEVPMEEEEVRMLYTFDNVYPDGQALLRIQPLPTKGKNYAYLTPSGESEAKKYFEWQMHPVYMRIDAMGREQWGAVPPYFPLEGTSGESSRVDLFAPFPLPMLPQQALFPGDSWQSAHLFSTLNLDKLAETEKITTALTSRGTFLGVEWEKGIPCAKFNVALDAGPRDLTNVVNLNNQPGEATRVTLEGVVWFSLDQGVIVKSELTYLQESMVTIGTPAGGTGAGTGAAGGGAPTAGGAGGGAPTAGGAGGGGSAGSANFRPGDFQFDPHLDQFGNVRFFRQRGGPPGLGDPGPGGAGRPGAGQGGQAQGPGFGQRTGGGSGGEQKMLLRIRLRMLTELEK
jgi:hypothetical protein